MKPECSFDSNAFILPASREERGKLVGGVGDGVKKVKKEKRKTSKRLQRKLVQLERKNANAEIRTATLENLKEYRLTEDIASKLENTACHSRKAKKTKRSCDKIADSECAKVSASEDDTVSDHDLLAQEAVSASSLSHEVIQEDVPPCDSRLTAPSANACTLDEPSKHVFRRDDSCLLRKRIVVQRDLQIEKQRLQLPAVALEQEIVEAVLDNDIVIITGATGCGKSTQVPQFLYEAGFCGIDNSCLIGITQPRRVAVTSLTSRVGVELNDPSLCGYQIRYDSAVKEGCCLKFMTDGILLREIQSDFLCSRYSVFVLDEAHERSVNCDLLLGLLSRVVALRRDRFNKGVGTLGPLRLVIMSATLRVTDFTENRLLFPTPPPIIDIPARMYPVNLHFSRTTPTANRLRFVTTKVVEIHRKLPAGSILVFVSGRREVHAVCSAVAQRLQRSEEDDFNDALFLDDHHDVSLRPEEDLSDEDGASDVDEGFQSQSCTDSQLLSERRSKSGVCTLEGIVQTPSAQRFSFCEKGQSSEELFCLSDEEDMLNNADCQTPSSPAKSCGQFKSSRSAPCAVSKHVNAFDEDAATAAALGFDSGTEMGRVNPKQDQEQNIVWKGYGSTTSGTKTCRVRIVPLYALLPITEQAKAFEPPSDDERVIVVATNVAETSLTLPNIRYVVDSGKEKKRRTLHSETTSVFSVEWISKASADQRAGRAGRVGPGHCYRLYSSAVYTDVFPSFPVVQLLVTPLDAILLFMASMGIPRIDTFPFPTRPPAKTVARAQELLIQLGAIQKANAEQPCRITTLGRLMSQIPVSPRFALAIVSAISRSRNATQSADLVPACCSVVAGWTVGQLLTSETNSVPPSFSNYSDAQRTWWLMASYARAPNKEQFCTTYKANGKQLSEAKSLFDQLLKEVHRKINADLPIDKWLRFPPLPTSPALVNQLHQCLALGLLDNLCVRHDLVPLAKQTQFRGGYLWSGASLTPSQRELHHVTIHRSSAAYDLRPRPAFIIFSHLLALETDDEALHSKSKVPKCILRECFPVDCSLLASLSSPLIQQSSLLPYPPPAYLPTEDRVVGFVNTTYLPLEHALTPTRIFLSTDNDVSYRLFARAFLKGEVFPQLKALCNAKANYLKVNLSWLNQPLSRSVEQNGQKPQQKQHTPVIALFPKTSPELQNFVSALQRRQCASKATLLSVWTGDPQYLLQEFCLLLSPTCPKSIAQPVLSQWGKFKL